MNTTDLEQQAIQIDAQFQRDMAALQQRADLSPQGKHENLATLDAKRRQQVEELQKTGRARLEAEKAKNAAALLKARTDEIEAQRQTLGDVVLAGIYARQLAVKTGSELVRAYQSAVPGWEQMLIGALALTLLDERVLSTPTPSIGDSMAQQELERLTTPEVLQTAESQHAHYNTLEQIVGQLDLQAYRQSMADKFRLDPAHVHPPFASYTE